MSYVVPVNYSSVVTRGIIFFVLGLAGGGYAEDKLHNHDYIHVSYGIIFSIVFFYLCYAAFRTLVRATADR